MLLKVLIILLEKALITVTIRQWTKLRQRNKRYSILFLKAIGNGQWGLFEKKNAVRHASRSYAHTIPSRIPYLHKSMCVFFSLNLNWTTKYLERG